MEMWGRGEGFFKQKGLAREGIQAMSSFTSRPPAMGCNTAPAPRTQRLHAPSSSSSSRRTVVSARASSEQQQQQQSCQSRRQLLLTGLALGLCAAPAAQAADTFLKSTGARGFLSDEEEVLYQLRVEKEGEARKILDAERELFEKESKLSQEGKLCATPFGVDVVGISESVALIGALVGGISARQRKDELERLNEQLRKINLQLRQQARSGTIYAPGLTYAPPSSQTSSSSRAPQTLSPDSSASTATATATATVTATAPSSLLKTAVGTILSMEEDEMTPDQLACRDALRAGKRLLKEKNGSAAMVRFEKALMLSKAFADKVQERRASRGLAAAARLQGQYRTAIKYLERVLEISRDMKEFTGDADAYGTIADCYTDMGEFEKAAKYYDMYISDMNMN